MRIFAETGFVVALVAMVLSGWVAPLALPIPQEAPQTGDQYPSPDLAAWSLVNDGMRVKATKRALEQRPNDPAAIEFLLDSWRPGWPPGSFGHIDLVVAALRAFVAGGPEDVEIAAGLLQKAAGRVPRHEWPEHRSDFEELVADIRGRLPELPREQAARTVRSLIPVEHRLATGASDIDARLRAFGEEYAGTEAALHVEVDLVDDTSNLNEKIERLEAFAAEHPSTAAGAAALHRVASEIITRGRRLEPRSADPTERFLRVLAIIEELESGRWPSSPRVVAAHRLLARHFVNKTDTFEPGNIERMLDAYRRFLVEHIDVLTGETPGSDLNHIIARRVGPLYERLGNRRSGIESVFDSLERETDRVDLVRTVRVDFYVDEADRFPEERADLIGRALAVLADLSEATNDTYARKAVATVAALEFSQLDFEAAIETYRSYLTRWPESPWAWVAALRIGQAQEALDRWQSAIESYHRAARDYPSPAPSAVLANTLAARAEETVGNFDEALEHYVAAASAWDDDFGSRYSIDTRFADAVEDAHPPESSIATHADISERIAELTESTRFLEGRLLESGRRLLDRERWQDARQMFESLVTENPRSPLAAEVRYLAHHAQLESALEIVRNEARQSAETTAFGVIEALSNEPWDPAVGVARLAHAALVGIAGDEDQARTLTQEALQQWLANQYRHYGRVAPPTGANKSLAADVVAIRRLITEDWVPGGYVVARSELPVVLAGGRRQHVFAAAPIPGRNNILFMDREHSAWLSSVLDYLADHSPPNAGTGTSDPDSETRPDILALWREFFSVNPTQTGWSARALPFVGVIEFQDEERTRARVQVTTGPNLGHFVDLEKKDGLWIVVRMFGRWVA